MSTGTIDLRPGAISVVRLGGDHHQQTERQVRETLMAELEQGRCVVVSLERVTLLGSPVIGSLVAAQLTAEHAGLFMGLVVPEGPHRARHVLELIGLLDGFAVYARMPDALLAAAAFGAPPVPIG
jgi:anti-anti-sigma regulatory factor